MVQVLVQVQDQGHAVMLLCPDHGVCMYIQYGARSNEGAARCRASELHSSTRHYAVWNTTEARYRVRTYLDERTGG